MQKNPLSIVDKQISNEEIEILLHVFPEGIVFLDLETTGLSPILDKIIEISAIKITADKKIKVFDQLTYPEIPIPEHSTLIHNITDEMVKGLPPIGEVLPSFLRFIENYPLVAQNAKFDIGFIVFSLYKSYLKLPASMVYDSCRFARKVLPDLKSFSLSALTKYFNIPLENHHRALDDSLACLKMVSACFALAKTIDFTVDQIRGHGHLFHLEDFKNLTSLDIPSNLKGLIPKTISQEIFEIEYRGGSHPDRYRPIRPVSIMPLPQGVVVYAFCFLSNIYKSFSIKKIKTLRAVSESEQRKWRMVYEEVTGHKT